MAADIFIAILLFILVSSFPLKFHFNFKNVDHLSNYSRIIYFSLIFRFLCIFFCGFFFCQFFFRTTKNGRSDFIFFRRKLFILFVRSFLLLFKIVFHYFKYTACLIKEILVVQEKNHQKAIELNACFSTAYGHLDISAD